MKRLLKKLLSLWTICVGFATGLESRGGEFLDRIESVPQAVAAKRMLSEESLQFILNFDREHGPGLPSFADFLDALSKADGAFPSSQFSAMWNVFTSVQKPEIDNRTLEELYLSRWRTLESFTTRYNITDAFLPRADAKDGPAENSSNTLVRSGSKFRLDSKYVGPIDRSGAVRSFDGDLFRSMDLFSDQQCSGWIAKKYDSETVFFPTGSPIRNAKLIPANPEVDGFGDARDSLASIARNSAVYEAEVVIDGEPCLVLGSSLWQLYLSRNHGYAVKRAVMDRYRLNRDDQGRSLDLSSEYSRLDNSNFKEVAPGIWLPEKSSYRQFSQGEVVGRYDTSMTVFDTAARIEDVYFEDIFQAGCVVSNMEEERTFRAASPDGAVPVDGALYTIASNQGWRIALIAVNLIVILALGIMLLRKQRSSNN